MLVSRYEEFRKRRNRETTLSKKNLLNEKDDNSQSSHRTETEDKVSSSKEIEPPKEETVERVITAEKMSRVVPIPNSECENVEETHPNKVKIEQVNKNMDPPTRYLNHAVEMAEAELVEETKEEKEQEVGAKGNSPAIVVLHKSRSADSVQTAESTNSNEVLQELEPTSKRKGHKKKFGAMRTLLKVKSLYHPMCTCTGDDRSLIVTTKATK
ncbi:hypothetical protein JHK87_019916 [Glycine soja]|nr:hypothetical protein JHK87_019916 [Glycine soja]